MVNDRWEARAIARWFNDKESVFEPIKGKHLYHTSSRNNYMLNPQCEEKIQVIGTPFLYKEPEPSDLKLQETLFFVIKISYYFWLA